MHLLWFDDGDVDRIRGHAAWGRLLDEAADEPHDLALELLAGARDSQAIDDHRDCFHVMTRGAISDVPKLREAVRRAVRQDGAYVPPLALLEGQLAPAFDAVERLRATAAIALSLCPDARALAEAAARAAQLASSSTPISPTLVDQLTTQLRDAFRKEHPKLGPNALDGEVEHGLLMGRLYQHVKIFGGERIRAAFRRETVTLRVYLPAEIADALPMQIGFDARVLVEARPLEDSTSPSLTLRAIALARLLPRSALQ